MPWSRTEDETLIQVLKEIGTDKSWTKIAAALNNRAEIKVYRHPNQCRERWVNHLDPTKNRGAWSDQDDNKLLKLFLEYGRKWMKISKQFGDRSYRAVNNRWTSLLKKYRGEFQIASIPEDATEEEITALEKKFAKLLLEAKKSGLSTAGPQDPSIEESF